MFTKINMYNPEQYSGERIPPSGWTVYVLYPTDRPDLHLDLNQNRISLFHLPNSSNKFHQNPSTAFWNIVLHIVFGRNWLIYPQVLTVTLHVFPLSKQSLFWSLLLKVTVSTFSSFTADKSTNFFLFLVSCVAYCAPLLVLCLNLQLHI